MCQKEQSQLSLWQVGRQRLEVTFDEEPIVSDVGLLAIRALERPLGILSELAGRLPDPRSAAFVHHSVERILAQQVYQVLAGYPDCNDARQTRSDPLFQLLAELSPDPEEPLASGSTLSRFQYAYTRRLRREGEPDMLNVCQSARVERIRVLNDFLADLFIRTRPQAPAEVVLDVDATDDPVHGGQSLSGYHGYYRQHQYFPLLVFDGASGFPLACWLRPGTAHASLGAVGVLRAVVRKLRAAWPGVPIKLRADNGLGVPEVFDFCEQEQLGYAIGYASNAVLERAVAQATDDVEVYYANYGLRQRELVQRFEEVKGYQAGSWPHCRRVVAKVERGPQGSQRRFVVSNLPAWPEELYRGFYAQRGAVPERPIGELKNGLRADRLSASGFCANAWRLLVHAVAYALVVLFREGCASVPEVARAEAGTLRQLLWKVPAVVTVTARRVRLRLSATWPGRGLLCRVLDAVAAFVERLGAPRAAPAAAAELPM